jgi:hypothetical protein
MEPEYTGEKLELQLVAANLQKEEMEQELQAAQQMRRPAQLKSMLVAEDLAPASDLPASNFHIGSVSPGSVMLDAEVMPELSGRGPSSTAADQGNNFNIKAVFGSVRQAPQTVDNKEANEGLSMTKQGPDDSHTKKSSAGTLAGVGMVLKEIKMQNEVPVLGWFGADMLLSVEALTPGAPAISSGKIFPGDTLIAVDGKKITSLQEATKLILGEPGSAIKMHFDRHGRRFVVELQRGTTASRGQQSAHDTQALVLMQSKLAASKDSIEALDERPTKKDIEPFRAHDASLRQIVAELQELQKDIDSEQRHRRSEEDDTQLALKDSAVKEALALQDIRRIEFLEKAVDQQAKLEIVIIHALRQELKERQDECKEILALKEQEAKEASAALAEVQAAKELAAQQAHEALIVKDTIAKEAEDLKEKLDMMILLNNGAVNEALALKDKVSETLQKQLALKDNDVKELTRQLHYLNFRRDELHDLKFCRDRRRAYVVLAPRAAQHAQLLRLIAFQCWVRLVRGELRVSRANVKKALHITATMWYFWREIVCRSRYLTRFDRLLCHGTIILKLDWCRKVFDRWVDRTAISKKIKHATKTNAKIMLDLLLYRRFLAEIFERWRRFSKDGTTRE